MPGASARAPVMSPTPDAASPASNAEESCLVLKALDGQARAE